MTLTNGIDYPLYPGDLKLAHPEWEDGDPLPEGWSEVIDAPRPEHSADEISYLDFPVEVDGVLTQNWKIRPMTAEEIDRRDAPKNAKAKLMALGLTEAEVFALSRGLVF